MEFVPAMLYRPWNGRAARTSEATRIWTPWTVGTCCHNSLRRLVPARRSSRRGAPQDSCDVFLDPFNCLRPEASPRPSPFAGAKDGRVHGVRHPGADQQDQWCSSSSELRGLRHEPAGRSTPHVPRTFPSSSPHGAEQGALPGPHPRARSPPSERGAERVGGLNRGSRHPVPRRQRHHLRRSDGTDGDRVRYGLVIPGDYCRPSFCLDIRPAPAYIGPTISPCTVFGRTTFPLRHTQRGCMKTPVARAEDLSLRVAKAFIEDEGRASPA
jgi:hypothetical protein